MPGYWKRSHMATTPFQKSTVVPRKYTPEKCRLHGCTILVGIARIVHDEEELEIPSNHLDDPSYDIWGQDVKPWLEARHGTKVDG